MEQIGVFKLFHLPKALEINVSIVMLDLDVGFLDDPMKLFSHQSLKNIDIMVQKDVSNVMHRDAVRWKTWFQVPMPNIGLLYSKGNDKTVGMFRHAWEEYQAIKLPIKQNPGKDQNKVVNALTWAKRTLKLKWKYIDSQKTVLLDKLYVWKNTTFELGGEAARKVKSLY